MTDILCICLDLFYAHTQQNVPESLNALRIKHTKMKITQRAHENHDEYHNFHRMCSAIYSLIAHDLYHFYCLENALYVCEFQFVRFFL